MDFRQNGRNSRPLFPTAARDGLPLLQAVEWDGLPLFQATAYQPVSFLSAPWREGFFGCD